MTNAKEQGRWDDSKEKCECIGSKGTKHPVLRSFVAVDDVYLVPNL